MKTILNTALISLSVMTAGMASASDGTVNFEGSVIGESCNIDISQGFVTDNGNPNGLVTLPNVSLSAFPSPSSKAGATNFQFTMTDCTPNILVRPYFEATNVNPSTGFLVNTVSEESGGATDVELEILNFDNESIDLRTNPEATNEFADVGDNGTIILHYKVQYTSRVNPTAGAVNSAMTYTLQYK